MKFKTETLSRLEAIQVRTNHVIRSVETKRMSAEEVIAEMKNINKQIEAIKQFITLEH